MELGRLLATRFIREVIYPNWLANMVIVSKKEGRWRFYVDYTNLNDVYPNDSFLLLLKDQIIDVIVGHGMFSFLDAFSGYHQIFMFQSY